MFASMQQDPAAMEAALLKIPGVRAARVVVDAEGAPSEIHIVAGGEKSPKQLVRDVQTVALATLGMAIDHRIVSVVSFPDSGETPFLDGIPPEKRITIDEIATETRGTASKVRVLLSWGDTTASGEASGFTSADGLLRMAAQATLEAVRGLLADSAWLALEHSSVQRVGTRDVAVATVAIGAGGTALSGSAVVIGQHTEAIVRAVLDALNRRMTPMERGAQTPGGAM